MVQILLVYCQFCNDLSQSYSLLPVCDTSWAVMP